MTGLAFPDNTVLINFALIGRMDLLERAVNGRGRWCQSVASECDASSRHPDLAELLKASAIFGDPWFATPAEHISIMILRDQLASPGDPLTKHLGEAETIVLAGDREPGSRFVTDDTDAVRVATNYGLTVVTTRGLLALCVRVGWISADEEASYLAALHKRKRHLPW